MDLLKETQLLCKLYKISPDKSLGQNFLVDENVLNNIIKNAEKLKVKNKKLNILEVGGGFGFLTNRLVNIADKVFVVEKDEQLFNGLKKIEKVSNNKLMIALGDALRLFDKTSKEKLLEKMRGFFNNEDYVVVANIPYNITSHIIRMFLVEKEYFPQSLILMIQREVAERVCSLNNNKSVLSMVIEFYADTKILFNVDKKSFFPEPRVNSSVIKIQMTNEHKNKLKEDNPEDLFKFINIGFSNRRKMLHHNISCTYKMDKDKVKKIIANTGLNEKIRAQDLDINDWINLWYNVKYENKK